MAQNLSQIVKPVVVTNTTSNPIPVSIDGTVVAGDVNIHDSAGNPITTTAGALNVNASFTPSGIQNVNLTQVGGSAIALVATRLPVDGSGVTQPVSATSLPLPTGASTSTLQTTGNSSLSSIDTKTPALVSGRVPVDGSGVTQPVSGSVSVSNFPATQPISGTVTANAGTNLNTSALALDTSVNSLLKPASTLTAVTTVGTITNAVTVQQAVPANLQTTSTQLTLTKGTQGSTGISTQDLKDAGRNVTNYFMVTPVVTTAADVLQSLTGYKSNAAVGATTTPAVVTASKVYRITSITMTYVAIATAGTATFTLRANTGGNVVLASPAVNNWTVGTSGATAGFTSEINIAFPDGLEFAAGTGIGISVLGRGATQTAAAVGFASISISGYEY